MEARWRGARGCDGTRSEQRDLVPSSSTAVDPVCSFFSLAGSDGGRPNPVEGGWIHGGAAPGDGSRTSVLPSNGSNDGEEDPASNDGGAPWMGSAGPWMGSAGPWMGSLGLSMFFFFFI